MKIYVASRTEHCRTWQYWRTIGYPICSSWIDEGGPENIKSWPNLWTKCINEVRECDILIAYISDNDRKLNGALVEIGAALALGKPIIVVCTKGTLKKYSVFNHPNVKHVIDMQAAFYLAKELMSPETLP